MKNKCKVCGKKVGLDYYLCKCSPTDMFCSVHRFGWQHGCVHDFKADQKKKLSEACQKAVAVKVEAI